MTPLPSLAKWERTSHSLHEAAMLLGAIRQLTFPRVPNYLELAMRVEPNGLATDTLPGGGVVRLDLAHTAMTYTPKPVRRSPSRWLGRARSRCWRRC